MLNPETQRSSLFNGKTALWFRGILSIDDEFNGKSIFYLSIGAFLCATAKKVKHHKKLLDLLLP